MLEVVTSTLSQALSVLPFVGLLFVSLYLGKLLYDKTTNYKFDDELTNKDNAAFGTHLGLYMVGLAIALMGALFSTDAGGQAGQEFGEIVAYSALAIVLLRLSVFINDKFILNKFSVEKEMIQDKNVGTAFVVGGGCIATGLIINGAISADSESFGQSMVHILVYFALGQVFLILGAKVFQAITSYDVHKVIEDDDNMAAGISFGGFLVALGIIVKSSLTAKATGVLEEVVVSLVIVTIGTIVLVAARVIADKVMLPKSALSKEVAVDKNAGAAAVAASVFVSLALIFSSAISVYS